MLVNQGGAAAQTRILEDSPAPNVVLGIHQIGISQVKGMAKTGAEAIGAGGIYFGGMRARLKNRGIQAEQKKILMTAIPNLSDNKLLMYRRASNPGSPMITWS